ncbi:alpha/beta hydrolase [Castellaniella sp.]|uniref:alpha/beta hydrolase n=1 Tax=Castellaniella sp. TaxID=1955812 RepID=UPI002AFDD2E7|nr:alpha/beta hydrolase-fold protein [Castellaniella sp.]
MSLHATQLPGSPATGMARRLRLHTPDGPPPPQGWPLLTLLDGDWVWPLANQALQHCAVLIPSHGPLGSAGPEALARRALDYTPPAPDGGHWPDPRTPQWQGGGAPAFLDALLGPMLAWARTQTRLDPARHALYGHSYGGLCALFALSHRADDFAHILCASPSLWWHDQAILKVLDRLEDHPPARPIRLTLMAGTDEHWYPQPANPHASHTRQHGIPTLPAMQVLMRKLACIPRLDCRLELLDQLGHGQVLPASAQRAIALAAT